MVFFRPAAVISDSAQIAPGIVETSDIADNAVTADKFADGSVSGAKIADDAVDSQHIAAGAVDTEHIADDQVTLAKMAPGTDGNLITYDADGNPAAVPTGDADQVLTSNGAGAAPTFQTLTALTTMKVGTTTRSMGAASGTQNIAHGLGKTPVYVRLTCILLHGTNEDGGSIATSVYNGTTQSSVYRLKVNNQWSVASGTTFKLNVTAGGAMNQEGAITVDGTNISIAWTKNSSPGGTAHILWEAWA